MLIKDLLTQKGIFKYIICGENIDEPELLQTKSTLILKTSWIIFEI